MSKTAPVSDLWKKVDMRDRLGCWPWRGSVNDAGYGTFSQGRKHRRVRAHRIALLGERHADDPRIVLHLCDNRLCCRPSHLRLGTVADNNSDMFAKKRHAYGERAARAKLTETAIDKMKQLRKSGLSQSAVAEVFGVHQSTVSGIETGRNWKHLEG